MEHFRLAHFIISSHIELCYNVISNLVLSNDSRARNSTLFVGQSKTFWNIFANLQSHVSNIANETSDSSSFADDLIGILSFFRFVVFHRSSLFFVAWRQNPTETAVDEHLYATAAAAAVYNSIAML